MNTRREVSSFPGQLLLPPAAIQRVRQAAGAAWPNEGCGLLEGAITDSAVEVMQVLICTNVHEEPRHRYTIDPEAFLRAEHAARDRGQSIVGVWHSHPNGEPVPSATDLAEAWPGWSYLIAGVTNGAMTALRCWWLTEDSFTEQTITTASANREIPDERA